jgi:hypothetical protein
VTKPVREERLKRFANENIVSEIPHHYNHTKINFKSINNVKK